MSDRNWDAEMAKIDKQLSSISDDQLVAERRAALAPPARAGAPAAIPATIPARTGSASTTTPAARAEPGAWSSWVKVIIAVAAAVGLMFWPWPARCGTPLIGFTAATGGVALLGIWSAVGTWRHRLGLAHFASLLVVLWGIVLGARETLPRVGYAIPTLARPGGWTCQPGQLNTPLNPAGALPVGAPAGTPNGTP